MREREKWIFEQERKNGQEMCMRMGCSNLLCGDMINAMKVCVVVEDREHKTSVET